MANLTVISKVLLTLGFFLATANGFFMYSSSGSGSSQPGGPKKLAETRIGQQWTGGIMMAPGPFRTSEQQQQMGQQPPVQAPGYPPQYAQTWQQPQYATFDTPLTVAVPVAVPVHSQVSQQSMPTTLQGMIHGVQLVPCLCPVTSGPPPPPQPPMKEQPDHQGSQYTQSPSIVTTSQ